MGANVIKVHASGVTPAVSKITKEVRKASLEAREILAAAQDQAAQMLENARHECEQMLADSYDRGYSAGLDRWNDALAEAWKHREDFLAQNEAELVRLAVAIAKKIIGENVKADTDVVLRSVKDALRAVRSESKVIIKVNPSDEANLRQKSGDLKILGVEVGDLVIVGLSSIAAGGCVVESDIGIIDAQIDTQLDSIERALMRRFDVGSR